MITCKNLVKIYKSFDIEVIALQGLNLEVETGEMMGIIGSSGSGKSTLLNMLGGLDRPSAGELIVAGKDLLEASEQELIEYRRNTVGFVWQNNARNLLPYLTALENVELPMVFNSDMNRKQAKQLLELVGLKDRMNNKLYQLSGGEQQRVAIAIALANQPELLLADEPTGEIDTETADQIMDLFRYLNEELGVTIVIVTHDQRLSQSVERVVAIRDGLISSEFLRAEDYQKRMGELEGTSLKENSFHNEFAVLDQKGRLQIPPEYLEKANLDDKNKVELELKEGQIVLNAP